MPKTLNVPAREAVVHRFDGVEASLVRKIIERYLYEEWLTVVRQNPHIKKLVALQPGGHGIPWSRVYTKGPGYYAQQKDVERARAVLGQPKAKWEIYHSPQRLSAGHDTDIMVRRVR